MATLKKRASSPRNGKRGADTCRRVNKEHPEREIATLFQIFNSFCDKFPQVIWKSKFFYSPSLYT